MTELEIQNLVNRAIKARETAYCPYSHFAVGAALLCEKRTNFTSDPTYSWRTKRERSKCRRKQTSS